MEKMVTVIGRGHSGTRAISNTLAMSGFFMGMPLNASWDLIPPQAMYDACREFGNYVKYNGDLSWDFSRVLSMEPTPLFRRLVEEYLHSVLTHPTSHKGWKIPETTLCYPWIVKMFPEIYYIHWVRDPRDCIQDIRERRAISWKYQRELMQATPDPQHVLRLRFEDMVFEQDKTLRQLEAFLGVPMAKIPMRPESVGRYKTDEGIHMYEFFREDLISCGYYSVKPKT